jgi:hypothetical protein
MDGTQGLLLLPMDLFGQKYLDQIQVTESNRTDRGMRRS